MNVTFGQAIISYFISPLLSLLILAVFVNVVLSWLINFNVVNAHNQFVSLIWRFTGALTEPFLGPIRRILPALGGIDLSPIVLLLVIQFVNSWLLKTQICPILGPIQYCF